jgi:hypothetical protein
VIKLLGRLFLWHQRSTNAHECRRVIFSDPSKCLSAVLSPGPVQIIPKARLQLVLRAFRSARRIA